MPDLGSYGVPGRGEVRFLYVSPEQPAKEEVVERLADAGPALFLVDEAQCVSSWGHDFRRDYLRLEQAVRTSLFPATCRAGAVPLGGGSVGGGVPRVRLAHDEARRLKVVEDTDQVLVWRR